MIRATPSRPSRTEGSRSPIRITTGRRSLAGKRLGVVRDFMIEATIADRENIRIANEALADMKSLGATLVDPVDFSGAIAEIMTAYEPSFFTQTFPVAIPVGT